MSEFDCSLEVRVWMAQKLLADREKEPMPGYLTREQFENRDLGEPFPGDYIEEGAPEESCSTCDGSGWLYITIGSGEGYIKDGCPDCAPILGADETITQARERMSPAELAADLAYEEQRCEACGAAWKGCKC